METLMLLRELGLDPASAQAIVRRTVCSAHQTRPYSVLATFFQEGYGIVAQDSLETVEKKVASQLHGLGAQPEEIAMVVQTAGYLLGLHALEDLREVEPERLNKQISMMLRTVLDYRLRQAPLVLVIEDLQWADAASLETLRTMADWLHQRPLMMLVRVSGPLFVVPIMNFSPNVGLSSARCMVCGLSTSSRSVFCSLPAELALAATVATSAAAGRAESVWRMAVRVMAISSRFCLDADARSRVQRRIYGSSESASSFWTDGWKCLHLP